MPEIILLVADLLTLVVASALLLQGRVMLMPFRYQRVEASLVQLVGVSQNKGTVLYYPTYQVVLGTGRIEVTSVVGTFRKEPSAKAWMLIHKKSKHASLLRDQRISFGLGLGLVLVVFLLNVVR